MKRVILTGIAILYCVVLSAQIKTLQDCLEIGLEQNYSIRIVKADQQISVNNATRAASGALPTIGASGGYNFNRADNWYVNRETSENSSAPNVMNQRLNLGVALNWTVFEGFKIQTNYKRLLELEKVGEVNTRIAVENFISSLTAEYYNYIQQNIRLKNLHYAAKLSRERLRIVEERYTIGNFSLLEVQQARVYFNADSSKYMSQQTVLHSSRINLNQLMANENVEEMIIVKDSIVGVNDKLDYNMLYQQMLESNATLIKSTYNQTLAQLNLKSVLSRNYPYVKLNTGYAYGMNLYNKAANARAHSLGFDAGITLGVNLFDFNRHRDRSNAKIDIQKTELQTQEILQILRSNISNFWQAYLTNIEIVKLELQNLSTAKDSYAIAMERYMLGNLSGIEMRESQKSLLDAEERLLSAQYAAKLCEISLLQVSGRIFEYLVIN